jgi:hypothetical protein
MQIARRFGLGAFLGVFVLTLAYTAPASAAAPAKKATAPPITTGPQPQCSKVTPSCGTDCTNMPLELTRCWTTPYGPAKADVVVVPAGVKPAVSTNSPNLLSCQGGGYALCAFSGPPNGLFGGQALPCTLDRHGLVANCTCQYYKSGAYFVDINAILNQGAYFQAVKQCGADGCGCLNITTGTASSTCPSTPPQQQATVCNYVNNQSKGDPASSFYPKGQIVSTFSFAMSPQEGGSYIFAAQPTTCHGKYAGCMTAACKFSDGSSPSSHNNGDPIQCECPVYDGDYQVSASGQSCTIPSSNGKSYVWSASRTVAAPAASSSKK